MSIQPIQHINVLKTTGKLSRERKESSAESFNRISPVSDVYEPSTAPSSERAELLSSIKKRIKSGYYNSKEVLEDLSDSFAKVLDKTL